MLTSLRLPQSAADTTSMRDKTPFDNHEATKTQSASTTDHVPSISPVISGGALTESHGGVLRSQPKKRPSETKLKLLRLLDLIQNLPDELALADARDFTFPVLLGNTTGQTSHHASVTEIVQAFNVIGSGSCVGLPKSGPGPPGPSPNPDQDR